MNPREFLNNNPALVTIGAIVLLIICLAIIVIQLSGRGGFEPVDLWYYDEGTGQLFIADTSEPAPIDAPSGAGAGVRAVVYACGECPELDEGMNADAVEAAGAFIAYLEKYEPMDAGAAEEEYYEQRTLIRTLDSDQWISMETEEGMMMMEQDYSNRCPGEQYPTPCLPE
jgi:hypothetical protein